jgi:hypothetical protein
MNKLKNLKPNQLFSKITGNPMALKIVMLVGIFISTLVIMISINALIMNHLKTRHNKPIIIEGSKNAKNSMIISQDPSNKNSIMLYRSDDQNGIEFSYSVWFVIENMEYMFGEWKHMFHKGNKTSYPNRAPGVFIHPDKNSLRIYMNTFDNILEHVDIHNIPLRRWVHMVLSVNHSYLDVYINGSLKIRHEFKSTPKQNFGDLWLNLFGGFEGYLCKMQYFRRAITYQEVENITKQGPSKNSCIDGGDKPPYLDDDWWFK